MNTHIKSKIEFELDSVNYATKSDLKNATVVDTSDFSKKADLASLKSDIDKLEKVPSGLSNLKSNVDKLDVDKLIPAPVTLNKLSEVVDKEAVKKDVHDELVIAIQTTNTSDLVLKS